MSDASHSLEEHTGELGSLLGLFPSLHFHHFTDTTVHGGKEA